MKNIKVWGIVIAIVLAIGFYSLPYITIAQMKAAAEENNGEALSEHVDFPSVRQSLKDQMNAMLAREMVEEVEDNPFVALGAAFGGMFVEKMVDAYITPAGLTQLMSGESPDEKSNDITENSQKNEPFQNTSLSYESMSKFSVIVNDEDSEEGIKFILRRTGLSWKLSEILLPM
tara:strand:+ start:299 stop:820 length:522 start_codon:yes stop_codon:yes gene_type:complete